MPGLLLFTFDHLSLTHLWWLYQNVGTLDHNHSQAKDHSQKVFLRLTSNAFTTCGSLVFQKVDVCVKKHWTRLYCTNGFIYAVKFILSPQDLQVLFQWCDITAARGGEGLVIRASQVHSRKSARLKGPFTVNRPPCIQTFYRIKFVLASLSC